METAICSLSTTNSTIELRQTSITYGWTSSGVFTVFHPTILNLMQAQTPFVALRIVHKTLNQRSPEADTFLWDGSYGLPTLYLNMHIASLSCVPSQDLFLSVLTDLNTLLKVYAGQQKTLKFIQDRETIGYTLPSTSVSTNIPPYGSDIAIVNLYCSVFCFLYCVSVCLVAFWFLCPKGKRKKHRKIMETKMRENKELIAGMTTTAVTTIALEICARTASCIAWTSAIHRDSGWGNFLAVWFPQLFIFLFATTVNICGHILVVCKKGFNSGNTATDENNGNKTATGESNSYCSMCLNGTLRFLSSKAHIILTIQLLSFGLLYYLFPAIILIFAYPTLLIAIFTFVLAYLFSTTIIFAIMIKLYDWFEPMVEENTKKIGFFVLIIIPSWLTMLYIYCIVIVFLYSLIIGRGAVVNTGPLLIISIVPSALLSLVAWIAKRMILNGNQNICHESRRDRSASG